MPLKMIVHEHCSECGERLARIDGQWVRLLGWCKCPPPPGPPDAPRRVPLAHVNFIKTERAEGICSHSDFKVHSRVNEDAGEFALEIAVECAECGMPFQFLGVSGGDSPSKPTVGITEMDLSVPIRPFAATGPIPEEVQRCFGAIKRRQ